MRKIFKRLIAWFVAPVGSSRKKEETREKEKVAQEDRPLRLSASIIDLMHPDPKDQEWVRRLPENYAEASDKKIRQWLNRVLYSMSALVGLGLIFLTLNNYVLAKTEVKTIEVN